MAEAKISVEEISLPKDSNIVIGQAHFLKTPTDLFETLAEASPTLRFGLAFCEASGLCLVRSEGNDSELQKAAEVAAMQIACGHVFVIFLRGGFPVNVLNRVKSVSEVCGVFCATANAAQVVIAETPAGGRGVLGVVDGARPKGIENEEQRGERKAFLRKIGYKT